MAAVPAALLWDVDGTLAETEELGHRPAFNEAFAEAGLPWRWDVPTYRELLSISGGRERMTAYLRSVEGADPEAARIEFLARAKQAHYIRRVRDGRVPLRSGVARLIAEAAGRGLVQGIVTTSGRTAVQALAEGSLGELAAAFRFRICGEDVTLKKPHPEAYLRSLELLDLPPSQVLVLEDSANGLAAAAAAGLECLLTLSSASRHEPPERFAAARAVVDGLGDGRTPIRVLRGSPCPEGRVTLSYLQRLLLER
jgi:HAD superfamily hydrolase (TIGR01509 family)